MQRLLCTLLLCTAAALPALEIGDRAPALDGVTWVKGDPVTVGTGWTVVEFWATWCPPCLESIPHLTTLQERYADRLTIVGLSNEDRGTVEPFVADQGASMDYRVGLAGGADYDAYMQGVQGIPHAFLVDPEGVVVWKGHPMQLDTPLAAAMAGTLDPERAKRVNELEQAMQATFQSNDINQVIAATEDLLAVVPSHVEALRVRGIAAGMQNRPEDLVGFLDAIELDGLAATNAARIVGNLQDSEPAQRHLPHMLKLARHAYATAPDDPAVLAAYARTAYLLGDLDVAIAVQQQAVEHGGGDAANATLAYYRQARDLDAAPTP